MLSRLRDAVYVARQHLWGRLRRHTYDYLYRPAQLCFLAGEVERTDALEGSIVEVGCAFGATTVFLDHHLCDIRSDKRYYAIDTFSGFTPEDVAIESDRGRGSEFKYLRRFLGNSKLSYERTMKANKVRRVTAIETDVKRFDFTTIAPFSFCLVDVDLYQPVLATLRAVCDLMTPGGVIIVDDCDAIDPPWRGSYEAYAEFTAERGLPKDIRHTKLGVIQC